MLLGIMASWLAVGLVWCLALVKPEDANPGYFKSSLLVVLGLAVLAGISGWSVDPGWVTGGRIGVAAIAYAAFFCWSIEQFRAGRLLLSLTGVVGLAAVTPLNGVSGFATQPVEIGNAIAGAALLGVTMGAMLLGHYYLTAPWMSLRPINLLVAAIAVVTVVRAGFVGMETAALKSYASLSNLEWGIYLALRWGAGIAGILGLTYMTTRTLKLKATQAATGILYVVVIFALTSETAGVVFSKMAATISARQESRS